MRYLWFIAILRWDIRTIYRPGIGMYCTGGMYLPFYFISFSSFFIWLFGSRNRGGFSSSWVSACISLRYLCVSPPHRHCFARSSITPLADTKYLHIRSHPNPNKYLIAICSICIRVILLSEPHRARTYLDTDSTWTFSSRRRETLVQGLPYAWYLLPTRHYSQLPITRTLPKLLAY